MQPLYYCVAIYCPMGTITTTRIDNLQPKEFSTVAYDIQSGPDTSTPNDDTIGAINAD